MKYCSYFSGFKMNMTGELPLSGRNTSAEDEQQQVKSLSWLGITEKMTILCITRMFVCFKMETKNFFKIFHVVFFIVCILSIVYSLHIALSSGYELISWDPFKHLQVVLKSICLYYHLYYFFIIRKGNL